jgi:hypothetical protein
MKHRLGVFWLELKRGILKVLCYAFGLVALACFVNAVVLVGAQVVYWMKVGHWRPEPLSNLLKEMEWRQPYTTEWIGVQKIIDWVLDTPTALWMLAATILVAVLCVYFGELAEKLQQKRSRV